MTDIVTVNLARLVIPAADPFELAISVQRHDLCARSQADRGILFDTPNQIAGHFLRETGATHQHMDASGRRCQEDRRLASSIGASDHRDVLSCAQLRLHRRRTVVHTRPSKVDQFARAGLRYSAPLAMITGRDRSLGPPTMSTE